MNHYIVTAPNGATFTRKSARTYTHAVVARTDWTARRFHAENPCKQGLATDASNFAYYVRELGPTPRWGHTETQKEDMRARIEGCATVADYHAKLRTERMASVERSFAIEGENDWGVVGYCGRLDLARKLAAKVLWCSRDLTIVELVRA